LGGNTQTLFRDQVPYREHQRGPIGEVVITTHQFEMPVSVTLGYWDDRFSGPDQQWKDAIWYSYHSVYGNIQLRLPLLQLGTVPSFAVGISGGGGITIFFQEYLYGNGYGGEVGTDQQHYFGHLIGGVWGRFGIAPHWGVEGKLQKQFLTRKIDEWLRYKQHSALVGLSYQW